jgi:hypothetical protein
VPLKAYGSFSSCTCGAEQKYIQIFTWEGKMTCDTYPKMGGDITSTMNLGEKEKWNV